MKLISFLFIALSIFLSGCVFNQETLVKEKFIYVDFLPPDSLFKKCSQYMKLSLYDFDKLTQEEKEKELNIIILNQNQQIRDCRTTIDNLYKYKKNSERQKHDGRN